MSWDLDGARGVPKVRRGHARDSGDASSPEAGEIAAIPPCAAGVQDRSTRIVRGRQYVDCMCSPSDLPPTAFRRREMTGYADFFSALKVEMSIDLAFSVKDVLKSVVMSSVCLTIKSRSLESREAKCSQTAIHA